MIGRRGQELSSQAYACLYAGFPPSTRERLPHAYSRSPTRQGLSARLEHGCRSSFESIESEFFASASLAGTRVDGSGTDAVVRLAVTSPALNSSMRCAERPRPATEPAVHLAPPWLFFGRWAVRSTSHRPVHGSTGESCSEAKNVQQCEELIQPTRGPRQPRRECRCVGPTRKSLLGKRWQTRSVCSPSEIATFGRVILVHLHQ